MSPAISSPAWSGVRAGPRFSRKVAISTPSRAAYAATPPWPSRVGRRQAGKHRDEPDAESFPAGFLGGVAGEEPDGRLGSGIAAGYRRAAQRRPAGDRDDRAARVERAQQRLAGPVERVLHVHLPVAAEGLPGVAVNRPRQRGRAGVQHQRAGLVGVDQFAGHHGVGRVGGHSRERAAELLAHFIQRSGVAGDADDPRAGLGEGSCDATAEATAGAGDYRRRSG